MFDRLVDKIKNRIESASIQNLLDSCDASIYNYTNDDGETILHIALRYSTSEITILILNHLQKFPSCKKILNQGNHDGCTPIHIAARLSDYNAYSAIISALGDDASLACLTPNYLSNSAIHMFKDNPQPDSRILADLERRIIEYYSIPDINDVINFDNLIDHETNKDFYATLIYSYIALSAARRFIKQSATHPSANVLSQSDYDALDAQCFDIRDEYDDLNENIPDDENDENNLKKLDNIVNVVKKVGVGNCLEASYLVVDALLRMGIKLENIDIYHLIDGDHVFIVLNRRPTSDPENFNTWGRYAVVIDAWSGCVYPASKIPEKLLSSASYKKYDGSKVNFLVPYAAHSYQLSTKDEIKFSREYISSQKIIDNTIFTRFEIEYLEKIELMMREERHLFQLILDALSVGAQIEQLLTIANSSIYSFKNNDGNTLLHTALYICDNKTLFLIIDHLKEYSCYKELLHQPNHFGWTPIHIAAGYRNYDVYSAIINILGDEADNACFTPISKGVYAINLFIPDKSVRIDLERRFFAFSTINYPSKFISLFDIIKLADNDSLYAYLVYGYVAMSVTKRNILKTFSHPSTNYLTKLEYDDLFIKCLDIENICLNIFNNSNNSDLAQLANLEKIADIIRNKKMGNNMEYCFLVIDTLLRMGAKFYNLEIFSTLDKQHNVVVLNRKRYSDPGNFNTWGENAIVIDACLSGVYPARKIPEKLKVSSGYSNCDNRRINFLVPYHANYHRLTLNYDFNLSLKCLQEDRNFDVNIFTDYEINLLNEIDLTYGVKINPTLHEKPSKLIENPEISNSFTKINYNPVKILVLKIFDIIDNKNVYRSLTSKKNAIYKCIENSIKYFAPAEISELIMQINYFTSFNSVNPLNFLKENIHTSSFFYTDSMYDKIINLLDSKYEEKVKELSPVICFKTAS